MSPWGRHCAKQAALTGLVVLGESPQAIQARVFLHSTRQRRGSMVPATLAAPPTGCQPPACSNCTMQAVQACVYVQFSTGRVVQHSS